MRLKLQLTATLYRTALACAIVTCSISAVGQVETGKQAVDDPRLPNVLIIGDSISIGYTAPVMRLLEGKASVHRIPTNGQSTVYALEHINEWLGNKHWDIIHFNWGIWDIHHLKGNRIAAGGRIRTTPEQYKRNLNVLLNSLESTGAKLIWASTTPVAQPTDPSLGMNAVNEGDVPIYNRIAAKVMNTRKIAIDDLYAKVLPYVDKYRRHDSVHYNTAGNEFLAEQVAKSIQTAINTTPRKRDLGATVGCDVRSTIGRFSEIVAVDFNCAGKTTSLSETTMAMAITPRTLETIQSRACKSLY